MGPSLAIASGLEGRLKPGVLDFKGDPPPGGRKTGDSWSEPFSPITPLKLPELCPSLYWAKGTAAARAAWLQCMETRGVWGAAGPKGAVMAGWHAQGNGFGGCWVKPGSSPAAMKTIPVYLGAGQETYWLPLPPLQTVGRGWGWSGPGAKTPFRIPSRRG